VKPSGPWLTSGTIAGYDRATLFHCAGQQTRQGHAGNTVLICRRGATFFQLLAADEAPPEDFACAKTAARAAVFLAADQIPAINF
jgi:hypothetical protein